MAYKTSMAGAVLLLFALTLLINPVLTLIHPRARLNRRELLVIYAMMVMASPIPTLNLMLPFFKTILRPFYFATPENQWRELILPHIPHWLMPHDPEVARLFYEGGAQGQPIPWGNLQPYFLVWAPFIWALFLMMIATMVVMRKQWVENERLIYPLMRVPLAMTEQGRYGERISPFFKNPVMWAGFAIPALWGTMHGLYNYFPEIIPFAQSVDPFRMDLLVFPSGDEGRANPAYLEVASRFNFLGFFYFVKTDIAFSLWFFNLLSFVVRGIFGIFGIIGSQPDWGRYSPVPNLILAQQSMGAMLVLFLGGLWVARRHLRDVFRKAFLGDPAVDDSGEILSYRGAVILLIASSAVLVGWLWLAGLPLWCGLAVLFLAVALIFGFSRVVAEGGLASGEPPVVPAGFLVSAVGSSVIGPQGLVVLATTFMWTTARNFVMISCAHSLRLGQELGGGKRPLFWVMILALTVALGGAIWMIMVLAHEHGAYNLYRDGHWGPVDYDFAEHFIRNPSEPHVWLWLNVAIGATIMTLLTVARSLYTWWPLHPLGYAIGPELLMDHFWFDMFLAWLIKVLVLKYGGVRLYMKTRPFFMGMILGYFTPGGVYLIVDHFTGMSNNVIFWG